MENNYEVTQSLRSIKTFFKSWQFWRSFLGVLIGGLAGFLYYYFIGCTSGGCAITSNPYMSIIWGSLMGLIITSSPCSRGKC